MPVVNGRLKISLACILFLPSTEIFSNGMHLAAEFEDHDVFTRTLISLVHFQVAMPKWDLGLAVWHSCAKYFDIDHGWLEPRSRRIIQKLNARCCRKWSHMLPHGWSWLFGLSLLRMDKSGREDSPCTGSPNLNSLLRTIPWLEQVNLTEVESALWSTSLAAWYPS